MLSWIVMTRTPAELKFRNYYRCPYDGAAWTDEWVHTCNDRCPRCRAEIEPYHSEDIIGEDRPSGLMNEPSVCD
jgi:hypothetical protein